MDKTVEIILVATVVLITSLIVTTMVNQEADGFSDFISGESEDAQCDIYEQTCNEDGWEEAECDGDLPDSCDDPGGGQGATQN